MDIDSFKAAKDFYGDGGYKYIEVPWDCPEVIQQFTIPSGRSITPSLLDGKLVMVGSAEQSFLHKMLQGSMPNGLHQTITPCFRNDQNDELHQPYFIKLELLAFWENIFTDQSLQLAGDALLFFNQFLKATIVQTDIGYDIVDSVNKIELGSYGTRVVDGLMYTYGTGLAQPRLNHVIRLLKG